MTGPDRIWAAWKEDFGAVQIGTWADTVRFEPLGFEYIRRDPAVLATLPEVQALIAAAYEVGAAALRRVPDNWDCGHNESRLCDCGPYVEQWSLAADEVSALTPADATAALARIEREAEARGRVKGLREAADIAWLIERGW